ncbi:MAG TPA: hypothetical protein PLE61_15375 [Vicinamibacterales bacterium]|nr:hypothetical protein [Vicinamibacterales bacterium]
MQTILCNKETGRRGTFHLPGAGAWLTDEQRLRARDELCGRSKCGCDECLALADPTTSKRARRREKRGLR